MKIVSSGRVLNSRGFYEKKRRKKNVGFFLFALLFLSLVSLIIFLLRQERFLITGTQIQGENVIDRNDMSQVVEQLLDGKYFWLVPRANALVYPRWAIMKILINKFPRLKSVSLNLDSRHKLFVTIEERAPFALYCPLAGDCFFLDEDGLIFAPAPSFSRGVYFVYIAEEMLENPIGQRFMTDEEFQSLQIFMDKLQVLDIYITALEVGSNEYALVLLQNGRIKWRKGHDLNLVQSNLEAFLKSDVVRIQTNFLDRILYLDLRTKNKVFYKFK